MWKFHMVNCVRTISIKMLQLLNHTNHACRGIENSCSYRFPRISSEWGMEGSYLMSFGICDIGIIKFMYFSWWKDKCVCEYKGVSCTHHSCISIHRSTPSVRHNAWMWSHCARTHFCFVWSLFCRYLILLAVPHAHELGSGLFSAIPQEAWRSQRQVSRHRYVHLHTQQSPRHSFLFDCTVWPLIPRGQLTISVSMHSICSICVRRPPSCLPINNWTLVVPLEVQGFKISCSGLKVGSFMIHGGCVV